MGEQQAVLDYFIERLSRIEGVALAAVYGSFGTSAQSQASDVDIFFVPSEPDAARAGLQVIVDGVGYDLWPVSWERLDRIAALSDVLTPVLLDSRIVLASAEASERFEALRNRCRENLLDPAQRKQAASRFFDQAAARLGRTSDDDWFATSDAVSSLLTGLAFQAGTHLHHGPGRTLEDGAEWLAAPIRGYLRLALQSDDALDRRAALRAALAAAEATPTPPTTGSAEDPARMVEGGFEELHSVLTKIPRAAAAGQRSIATLAAVEAVREAGAQLHVLATGRWPDTEADSLDAYRASGLPDLLGLLNDPEALAAASTSVDEQLAALLTARGVRIRRVARASELG